MSLFDSKQEVFDIELTSHGKKVLSKGKFSPKYYAFFDDDVIYDVSYANVTESSNATADLRIRKQTPYMKSNYSLAGAEVKFRGENQETTIQNRVLDYETENLLKYALGTSQVGNQTGSYFDINFFEGSILTASNGGITRIFPNGTVVTKDAPVITLEELEIRPEIRVLPDPSLSIPPELIDADSQDIPNVSPILEDGTYVYTEMERLLIAVDENNTEASYSNFEIQVYKKITAPSGEEDLIKLKFATQPSTGIDENGFLVEKEAEIAEIDENTVEFYFDIRVDGEISTELLTNKVPKDALGRPILVDPLIDDTITTRTAADFSRRSDDDGEIC